MREADPRLDDVVHMVLYGRQFGAHQLDRAWQRITGTEVEARGISHATPFEIILAVPSTIHELSLMPLEEAQRRAEEAQRRAEEAQRARPRSARRAHTPNAARGQLQPEEEIHRRVAALVQHARRHGPGWTAAEALVLDLLAKAPATSPWGYRNTPARMATAVEAVRRIAVSAVSRHPDHQVTPWAWSRAVRMYAGLLFWQKDERHAHAAISAMYQVVDGRPQGALASTQSAAVPGLHLAVARVAMDLGRGKRPWTDALHQAIQAARPFLRDAWLELGERRLLDRAGACTLLAMAEAPGSTVGMGYAWEAVSLVGRWAAEAQVDQDALAEALALGGSHPRHVAEVCADLQARVRRGRHPTRDDRAVSPSLLGQAARLVQGLAYRFGRGHGFPRLPRRYHDHQPGDRAVPSAATDVVERWQPERAEDLAHTLGGPPRNAVVALITQSRVALERGQAEVSGKAVEAAAGRAKDLDIDGSPEDAEVAYRAWLMAGIHRRRTGQLRRAEAAFRAAALAGAAQYLVPRVAQALESLALVHDDAGQIGRAAHLRSSARVTCGVGLALGAAAGRDTPWDPLMLGLLRSVPPKGLQAAQAHPAVELARALRDETMLLTGRKRHRKKTNRRRKNLRSRLNADEAAAARALGWALTHAATPQIAAAWALERGADAAERARGDDHGARWVSLAWACMDISERALKPRDRDRNHVRTAKYIRGLNGAARGQFSDATWPDLARLTQDLAALDRRAPGAPLFSLAEGYFSIASLARHAAAPIDKGGAAMPPAPLLALAQDAHARVDALHPDGGPTWWVDTRLEPAIREERSRLAHALDGAAGSMPHRLEQVRRQLDRIDQATDPSFNARLRRKLTRSIASALPDPEGTDPSVVSALLAMVKAADAGAATAHVEAVLRLLDLSKATDLSRVLPRGRGKDVDDATRERTVDEPVPNTDLVDATPHTTLPTPDLVLVDDASVPTGPRTAVLDFFVAPGDEDGHAWDALAVASLLVPRDGGFALRPMRVFALGQSTDPRARHVIQDARTVANHLADRARLEGALHDSDGRGTLTGPAQALDTHARRLGRSLFAQPVLDWLDAEQVRTLYLCPHDGLFQIPLHALPTAAGDLLMDRGIATAILYKSAHALALAPARVRDTDDRFVLWTDPAEANEHFIAARDTLAELPTVQLAATATPLEEAAETGAGVFLCHGLFDERPDRAWRSRLLLGHGARLTVREVEQRSVALGGAELFLAACSTARSQTRTGHLNIGLVDALLRRGARTVVAPISEVDLEMTPWVVPEYLRRRQAGEGPAQALSATVDAVRLDFAVDDDPIAWWQDWIRWAPFTVYGAA